MKYTHFRLGAALKKPGGGQICPPPPSTNRVKRVLKQKCRPKYA